MYYLNFYRLMAIFSRLSPSIPVPNYNNVMCFKLKLVDYFIYLN